MNGASIFVEVIVEIRVGFGFGVIGVGVVGCVVDVGVVGVGDGVNVGGGVAGLSAAEAPGELGAGGDVGVIGSADTTGSGFFLGLPRLLLYQVNELQGRETYFGPGTGGGAATRFFLGGGSDFGGSFARTGG